MKIETVLRDDKGNIIVRNEGLIQDNLSDVPNAFKQYQLKLLEEALEGTVYHRERAIAKKNELKHHQLKDTLDVIRCLEERRLHYREEFRKERKDHFNRDFMTVETWTLDHDHAYYMYPCKTPQQYRDALQMRIQARKALYYTQLEKLRKLRLEIVSLKAEILRYRNLIDRVNTSMTAAADDETAASN